MPAGFSDADGLPVLGVAELIERLRDTLGEAFGELYVEGEVAGLFRSRPGHLYFDLKDHGALLRSVMFRFAAGQLGFEPQDGMLVRARARLDLYPERGSLQLVVSELRPRGEGALRAAFEQLRARLTAEGLFDAEHKRPLPFLPRRIGIVTSLAGAAIHDFLRALRRRFPGSEVVVFDARVQGEGAWRELVRGLHLLDRDPTVEVIVLARGGGSLEDLWNFNREELVRAVFEAETPVVSAIGHETDWMLTDLVADTRAATPTAAAALVAPDAAQLLQRLDQLELRLSARVRGRLRELGHRLEALRRGLVHPARRLRESALLLRELDARLRVLIARAHERARARLGQAAGRLDALSPLAVLGRGYALAVRESDGAILREPGQAPAGAGILVRLARGELRATVRAPARDTGEG